MAVSRARHPQRTLLIALIVSTLLAACESSPDKPTEVDRKPVVEIPTRTYGPLEMPDSDHAILFQQVEQALDANNWMTAQQDLKQLPIDPPLPLNDAVYHNYLQARIAWLRGDTTAAGRYLQGQAERGAAPALNHKVLSLQRQLLAGSGDYLASARLGDALLHDRQSPDESATLKSDIWRDLMRAEQGAVRSARQQATESRWRGWLELATIGGEMTSPSAQKSRLQQWLANNATHPAAQPLPGGLGHWLEAAQEQQQAALLLPLSGRLAPAAKAVRDGYLAGYYAARQRGEATFDLQVLDTSLFDSTAAAYDAAVAEGANIIIGPLSKAAVTELGQHPNRTTPVIALNRVEGVQNTANSDFVQMSLAPEDDAQRIAELAYGSGSRRALVIRPAGAWGDKLTQTLRQRWGELGGSIAASTSYRNQDEYSKQIKTALNLAESEARSREIRSMLATNIEFTARRRQDIDVVFLLSRSGAEARSIKPLLAFHYAGSLPVYSTSSIYSGLPDSRDKDLNDINLVDIPWLLGSNPALRVAITAGDTGSDNYTRLNALGADAFRLQSRLAQLRAGSFMLVPGDTGLLTQGGDRQILREPSLATFAGGKLQPR